MDELIAQIRQASASGLYYLALLGALTLPDIGGALNSENGRASGPKYKDWVGKYVPEQADETDDIYGLRCSLLRQGQAKPKGGQFPIAFTHPSVGQLHKLSTVSGDDGSRIGWLGPR